MTYSRKSHIEWVLIGTLQVMSRVIHTIHRQVDEQYNKGANIVPEVKDCYCRWMFLLHKQVSVLIWGNKGLRDVLV